MQHHGLRTRILGAVILVALAVIFLPMLLNHRPENTAPLAELTERPASPPVQFSKIVVPAALSSENLSANTASTNVPSNKMDTMTVTWILQVASFSQAVNAQKLVTELQKLSFPAYVSHSTETNKPPIYRVYVGPYTRQEQATDVQKQLQKQAKLSGQIVQYNPLQP